MTVRTLAGEFIFFWGGGHELLDLKQTKKKREGGQVALLRG